MEIIKLSDTAEIIYLKDFLSDELQQELYKHLISNDNIKWTQGVYNIFGKSVNTPRLLWAMRDEESMVNEKYTVTDSCVWTDLIKRVKIAIEHIINRKLTYAQLNYYRNGEDYIGWHTDKELSDGDIIVSLSLGATRTFQFHQISNKDNKYELELEGGSLLIMNSAAAKSEFKHQLPKRKKVKEGRINITFREK